MRLHPWDFDGVQSRQFSPHLMRLMTDALSAAIREASDNNGATAEVMMPGGSWLPSMPVKLIRKA